MKKKVIKCLIVIGLLVGIVLNISTVKAEEKPTYTKILDNGIVYEFYGTIEPSRIFNYGESIDPVKDIFLDGYVKVIFQDGNIRTTKNLRIEMPSTTISKKSIDIVLLSIIESEPATDYYSSMIFNYPLTWSISIPIEISYPSENLICNYVDGSFFQFDNYYTWINGKKVESIDTIDFKFYNTFGEEVDGKLSIKKLPYQMGKSTVEYIFYPYNTDNNIEYNKYEFSINVEFPIKLKVIKKYTNKIVLSYNKNLEYKIGNSKKWQDSRVFTKLKPNTEYTIYSRQKSISKVNNNKIVKIKVKTLKE